MDKIAKVETALQPHQQRVVDRIQKQPGLVVAHGLGSGKSLSSIAAAEQLGLPTSVVVPKPLIANYEKELAKHVVNRDADYDIQSLQRVARGHTPEGKLLIVDEAHRAREPGTKTQQALRTAPAEKRLLLTGSSMYNRPADLANLVNIAAGQKVLPGDAGEFEHQFVGENRVDPGFWGRLRGIQPGSRPVLKNKEELSKHLQQWVDYHENAGSADFPGREDRTVDVAMSPEQTELYRGVMGTAPAWLDYKIRKGLPPSKQETKALNAFANAVRQVSLSPAGYVKDMTPEQALEQSPKLQAALKSLQEQMASNPEHRAVIYSNYLNAGVGPYESGLKAKGIPYGKFTGATDTATRKQIVDDYNAGKIRALLLSSAGGEGLDLKGTRQVQILEPHWNKEKVEQVIGRGIRYKSHEHLPEDQRKVLVEHFRSTNPEPGFLGKLVGKKREGAIDEYMAGLSKDKDALNEQVRGILRSHAEAQ